MNEYKQETIKEFEFDEKTTISLIKFNWSDLDITYSLIKNGLFFTKKTFLNKNDAENLYMLYKNEVLDFENEEYIESLEEHINKLKYKIKELKRDQ